ncbi:MAG: hypothetical protein K2P28_04445, partial [Lachnospiraceae bacterium]|nr:hypothetical protein [Lachnospiraceae bacterium]
MKSIVAVLLSTLLCVQTWSVPVSAMPVHEPILYEDTQEKTGGAEDSDTDTGKEQDAKENADDGEEIDTQGEVTAPKEEAQGEEQENDGTQADTDGQGGGGAGGMAVSAPSAILM